MREVTNSRDRRENILVGKYFKNDRVFPKKNWTPPDKPKLFLPGIRVNRNLEDLVPELTNTTNALSNIDLSRLEARLRQLMVAFSQFK